MPLKQPSEIEPALYIVSTPIGNLEDITLRALRVLREVDIIAAEDTRNTSKLLSHYEIHKKLISCHEHNEVNRGRELIDKIQKGCKVALVSDAGTPCISDPGFRLVSTAVSHGVKVVPVPGVSASIAALSVSGLSTDSFVFAGFPPKKQGKRKKLLESLSEDFRTLIFYESPHRILKFLSEVTDVLGDREASLSREITKLHEEHVRGNLSDIYKKFDDRNSIKGEITLVVSGKPKIQKELSGDLESEIKKRLKDTGIKKSVLAKEISKEFNLDRQTVYSKILKITEA